MCMHGGDLGGFNMKTRFPLWFKITLVFWSISMVSLIITFLFEGFIPSSSSHEGSIVFITAIPFLPYLAISSLYGITWLLVGLFFNTLIGLVIGIIVQMFVNFLKKRI